MSSHRGVRCGSESSVFWWRHCLNCNFNGNEGIPFELCDNCQIDLVEFLTDASRREKE